MKIKSRLTLWGTLVTLTTSAIICITLYIGLRFSLYNAVDVFLEGEIQEFLSILNEGHNPNVDMIEKEIRKEIGSRSRNDLAFRLLDGDGKLLATSSLHDRLPNPWVSTHKKNSSPYDIGFDTISIPGSPVKIRACSQRTKITDRDYIVQATYSLDGVGASLALCRNLCIAAMAFATVLSILSGGFLARKSLRPIYFMSRTIRKIGGEDLSKRLVRSNNDDELDSLAAMLNEMLARLERQFYRIQQFTADAAHELRTPLAALRGNAEVALVGEPSPENLRRVLVESIEEYDRLAKLADDLLLLARADSGHELIRREPLPLHRAARDVVDLYAPLAQEKRIDLQCFIDAPLEVLGDGGRIRQLMGNLLDNALKYTPEGGRVTVSLDSNDGMAQVTVADTGPGIPAEHVPHIFDRFYRVDSARSRGTGGFGLGLAICRTISDAHGGTINILPGDGGGTKVIVTLPIAS